MSRPSINRGSGPHHTVRRTFIGAAATTLAAVALSACSLVLPSGSAPASSSGTAPPSESPEMPQSTRLALISDFGTCDVGEQWVADQVSSWDVDAIVTAGDNTQNEPDCVPYTDSVWGYYQKPGDASTPVWPTLGNHDYFDSGAGLEAYRKAFPYLSDEADPKQRWYTEVVGGVTLFVLDSETSAEELEEQRLWLEESLTEQRAQHPDAWNMVLFHRPAYTSGEHEDNREMRPTAGWNFAGWGADIVISGHQHIYEDVLVDGMHYVTAGLGGGANFRECPSELREGSRRCVSGTGASTIDVTANYLELNYYQQDVRGKTVVKDTIRLSR